MKKLRIPLQLVLLTVTSLSLTGCYTQFVTADQNAVPGDRYSDYYSWNGNEAGNYPSESDTSDLADSELNAEEFYYKDYNTESWYRDHHASGLFWYEAGYMDGFNDGAYNYFTYHSTRYNLWPYTYVVDPFHRFGTNVYTRGSFTYVYWGYEYYNGYFTRGFFNPYYYNPYFYNDPYYFYRDFYHQYTTRTADLYRSGPRGTGLRSLNNNHRSRSTISKRGDINYRGRSTTRSVDRRGIRSGSSRTRSGSSVGRSTGRSRGSSGSSVGRSRGSSGSNGKSRGSGRSRNNDNSQRMQAVSIQPVSVDNPQRQRMLLPAQKIKLRDLQEERKGATFQWPKFTRNHFKLNQGVTRSYRSQKGIKSSSRKSVSRSTRTVKRSSSTKRVRSKPVRSTSRSSSSSKSSKRSRGGN